MFEILNNFWILGFTLILFIIIIKSIIKDDDKKNKNNYNFTSYIGKNVPTIVSYYIGLN
jgi:hypothetical protein